MAAETLTFPIRSDKLSMNVLATEHICHRKTEFQTIDVYDTEVFGRALLLDGHIQLTQFDEQAYHEALVQIPLLSMAAPKSALVVGGGDGGVIRELCRHKTMMQIDMVEIDEGVVEESRKHLPFLSNGAFDDPRVHLHIADAFGFVKQSTDQYDLIVVDATDVYEEEEGELSEMLFTSEFYRDCLARLTKGGMVVTQADNNVFCPYSLEVILAEFGKVFPKVGSYQALIPSFGGYSGFVFGSNGATLSPSWPGAPFDLAYLTPTTYALAFCALRFGG